MLKHTPFRLLSFTLLLGVLLGPFHHVGASDKVEDI